jgi:glycosyltransferase involved in cell wall biosynthesis
MKICTWGDVASALEGKTSGGGELQIALLAKVLAKLGHEVVIVDLMAEKDFVTEDGIKVFHMKGYNKGIKIFRFLTQRIPKLYSNLKAQKADVYYCQIRDFRHLLAYCAARKAKGMFVIQLASDLDAMSFRMRAKHDYLTHFEEGLYWFLKIILTELIFPRLVRKADLVLVQHEGQKNILLKKGIKSIIFNNLIELNEIPEVSNPERQDFSYVGALDKRKGFAEFYKLVVKAPFATFKVIGQPRDKTGYKYFEKLKSFKNVTLFGNLSHSETLLHILNSKALISTSPMEGFPNIFIEAWACGIPVLSLSFDPGGVIKKEGLGEVEGGNLDKLVEDMVSIRNTDEFAKRAKAYVEHNSVINADKIKEISSLFNELYYHKELKK